MGVVLRSQKDLDTKTIQQQIVDEKKWFLTSKYYRPFADKMGIPYLIKILNTCFVNHIRSVMPQIRDNIVNLVQV